MKRRKAGEALLVIDMLNDFCLEGSPLEVPSARDIIPNISREIKRAREQGIPAVYVCDSHAPDDPEFRYWPPHAVGGTVGADVVEELAPLPGDVVVEKATYSGFYKSRLDGVLRKAGVKALTFTGCVTNICVMYTASDAVLRGYQVRVLSDCVAGLDPQMHGFALRQMQEVLKAEVV